MFEKRYRDRLLIQRRTGLYRNPPEISNRDGKYIFLDQKKVLNFSSNDYLGLGALKTLQEQIAENFQKYGASSSSSRLVSGNYSMINEAERAYSEYFGYESALFFPSGYQANVGLISTLFEQGDRILFDKHIHASSVKGLELSGADFSGYRHNSLSHLEKRLNSNVENRIAVITESLFSMDGDMLDVDGFVKLKNQYGFFCIVDEAHAFGTVGTLHGNGGAGIAGRVADIAVGTFGKAFGLFGAFVLLPKSIKEYLFNFCSSLIYSTSLPEAQAASAMDILKIIADSDEQRNSLCHISAFMKEQLKREGFKIKGDAHILSIEVGDEKKAKDLSRRLLEKGIFVFFARYPTVPMGKAILRIGMTALHTEEDVKFFIHTLRKEWDVG